LAFVQVETTSVTAAASAAQSIVSLLLSAATAVFYTSGKINYGNFFSKIAFVSNNI